MTDALLGYLAKQGYYDRGYAMAYSEPPKRKSGEYKRIQTRCADCGKERTVRADSEARRCRSCNQRRLAKLRKRDN